MRRRPDREADRDPDEKELDDLLKRLHTLDPLLRPSWEAAGTDAARRRVVVDQVASLTDTSAIAWHHRLCAPGAS